MDDFAHKKQWNTPQIVALSFISVSGKTPFNASENCYFGAGGSNSGITSSMGMMSCETFIPVGDAFYALTSSSGPS